jgi:putative hydrolase of the HAD superfamily
LTWLLCDYGQVLSLPQPAADRSALAAASGLREDVFWRAYWDHRAAYDRAELTATDYWTAVLGAAPDTDLARRLSALDTASWLHPNVAVLAAVQRAAGRGYRAAILSNAPVELADALEHVPWLAPFQRRLFSCRLRLSKPDPAIYRAALIDLDAAPEEVIFLDDRADNVSAAGSLGIRAQVFSAPEQIDRLTSMQRPKTST